MAVLSPRRSISFTVVFVGSLWVLLLLAHQLPFSSSGLALTINQYLSECCHVDKSSLLSVSDFQTSVLLQDEKSPPANSSVSGIQSSDLLQDKKSLPANSSVSGIQTSDLIQDEKSLPANSSVSGIQTSDLLQDEKSLPANSSVSGIQTSDLLQDEKSLTTNSFVSGIQTSDLLQDKKSHPAKSSGTCDLYHGKWIYDPMGPLYKNSTCPIIVQGQNCQGNGRPDNEYENWRWKPDQCELPRFDARKFLELMRGKTLAFVGDSLARNQMESLVCILWQTETPTNQYNKWMHRWYFRSTSTTIIRIWSAWLVHNTPPPNPDLAREGVNIDLDVPDQAFMEFLPNFDVLVLSSGHWFTKEPIYFLNGTPINETDIIKSYSVALHTAMTAIVKKQNYTGLTILRTYSPGHYGGGDWNTGGSCAGVYMPTNKPYEDGLTVAMRELQVKEFEEMMNVNIRSKLRLMDITNLSGYRRDGHAARYRKPGVNATRNNEPQDCIHWCMPGPADTWNEILFEIIRRESCNKSEGCS